MNLFDEPQYLIEKKRATLRPTYNVKDMTGKVLGYYKGQMLKPNYWFEGTDGTRIGEIRSKRMKYEIYDAQNQPQAIVRPALGNKWKPPWLIEDSEGHPLAEIKQSSKFLREYQILSPDGSIMATITPIIKMRPSYRIDIYRQGLAPMLILSLFAFATPTLY